jgi:hypothetical protein
MVLHAAAGLDLVAEDQHARGVPALQRLHHGFELAEGARLEVDLVAAAAVHQLLLEAWREGEEEGGGRRVEGGVRGESSGGRVAGRKRGGGEASMGRKAKGEELVSSPEAVLCSPGPMAREMSGKPSLTTESACLGRVAVTSTKRRVGGAASLRGWIWVRKAAWSPRGGAGRGNTWRSG